MLKSMTAYGRATVVAPLGRFSVELQSVNRKHLEINTFLPSELIRYDGDIKKWIAEAIGRGQVSVRVSAAFEQNCPLKVMPNLALAKQVKSAWEALAQDLGLSLDSKQLTTILSRTDDILLYDADIEEEGAYRKILQEAAEAALSELIAMKITEGKALHADIATRINLLENYINEIAAKAPGATDRYRVKLLERIQEVLGASIENEERVLREVCVYAEKVDIAEELTRFNSHLQQARTLLEADVANVGKTLEFLVQEFNREANTIGSKSSDVDITRAVVGIKTELERIREQIQNIE